MKKKRQVSQITNNYNAFFIVPSVPSDPSLRNDEVVTSTRVIAVGSNCIIYREPVQKYQHVLIAVKRSKTEWFCLQH